MLPGSKGQKHAHQADLRWPMRGQGVLRIVGCLHHLLLLSHQLLLLLLLVVRLHLCKLGRHVGHEGRRHCTGHVISGRRFESVSLKAKVVGSLVLASLNLLCLLQARPFSNTG